MLLVTVGDVEDRLGRPLTPEEDSRFDAASRDVTAYLYSVAPRIPKSPPVPDAVTGVAASLVITTLSVAPGSGAVQSEALGGYSVTYRSESSSGGYSLNKVQEAVLGPWRSARIGTVGIDPTTAVAM